MQTLSIVVSPSLERVAFLSPIEAQRAVEMSSDPRCEVWLEIENGARLLDSIKTHWGHCMSHGSWYLITQGMAAWLRSDDLSVMPLIGNSGNASNLLSETVILIKDASRNPHISKGVSTLHRYVKEGRVNKRTGEKVLLESIELPEGKATTIEAYIRFIDRLN